MAVKLNDAGETHLQSLIDAGKYNADKGWDFTAEDGNDLLGKGGDGWSRYSSIHLGEDESATENTKARWAYPAAKANGDTEEVYRSGLEAAKTRAGQQGESDIEAAAGRLLDALDKKDGKTPGDDANKDAAAAPARAKAARDLPRIMTRIFGKPLMISPDKLDAILAGVGPQLGLAASPAKSDKQAAAFGALFGNDDGDDDDDDNDDLYDLTPDGIAVIGVDGTLVYKSSWLGAMSGLTAYGDVRAAFDAAVADPAVKGILLNIDSYGGEVNGCFDLCDAVFAARAQKPIYGAAADDSYSAAYALLAACSKIFVSRTSGVGSVGVVALHIDQSAADKMDGLKYTYIYSGDRKIDGNAHQPLSSPAQENLQAECDRLRALFAGSVAQYRGLSVDAVLQTQAGCFFGENAIAAKFADAIGTPADALFALRTDLAAKSAALVATAMMAAAETPKLAADAPDAGAIAAAAVAETRATADVIDLSVRNRATGDATALHAEIVSLCMLANVPQFAADFIKTGVSIADARKRIQDHRAHVSDARNIHGHIMPDAGDNNAQTAAAGWDTAIRAVRGKLKGE